MVVVAGIDVGKDSLEVWSGDGPAKRFDNSTAGISVLVDWLKEQDVSVAVYEPTGGYERQLAKQLDEAGLIPHMVHPIRMRSLARAHGFEAKTDGLDAQVLSMFGRAFPMADAPRRKPDPERDDLRDLLRRRRQLVNQRVQELNRLDKGITEGSRASTKRHIAWLDDEIARLDEEYQKALQSSSELSRRAALYQSVKGVGILTAAILAADLPELGEGDGKCLTSLVGLAPWSRDSGRQRGYRAIRGGRGTVASGPVHVSLVGNPKQEQRPGAFLPTATKARQARQSGIGGSDAETTSTVARHSSTGNSMGGGLRPSHLKTLDNQTQILRRRPESRGSCGAPSVAV